MKQYFEDNPTQSTELEAELKKISSQLAIEGTPEEEGNEKEEESKSQEI